MKGPGEGNGFDAKGAKVATFATGGFVRASGW
jgi:hypothetical protein